MPETQRRRAATDDGFTLVELLIAMMVFSIIMALLTATMITMMTQANDNLGRQRAVEQARLGLSQIDRQIRSGNLILDPASDTTAGVPVYYSLRILTQEGGTDKCVQWRVDYADAADRFGQLQYREWDPADTSTVTAWTRVASNVEKPASSTILASDSTTWPPFWVDTSLPTGTDAQNIRITLRMGDPGARTDAKAQVLTSVVTGRNTVFGYSSTYCNTVPAP
ncbi:PulJ/GspJ family protein [Demequina maris]|uniref:PulJ/GspJ family protein n=1 Tax=Demequina maris TaxID=1638982 RepID=UPI000782D3F5|nr:type II secretion system protein [Demequina maris]